MNDRWRRPRGTQDVLPPESARVERFRRVFYDWAERYGYEEIQTPVFEQTAVFVEGVGQATDIVQHERYTFVDAGGTSLTLRPEGTAAVARAYVEHGMNAWPQPVRLFYWQPMFRRERPQAGRFRQHQQYGVELYGAEGFEADAEVILLATRILAAVGKTPRVRLNSLGDAACRPAYRQALVAYYAEHRAELCEDCQARLEHNPLRLLDCKRDQHLKAGAPDIRDFWCEPCRDHFAGLTALLADLGVEVDHDKNLVRGLDYYHRTVFEVDDEGLGAQNTILGGGRYDGLPARFEGPAVPAVGFAGGVERLLLALGDAWPAIRPARVYLAQIGTGTEALRWAERLRAEGLPVVTDLLGRSLKAQMKDAARRARWAVMVGGQEWAAGRAPVRDLVTGTTVEVARDELAAWLRARIATLAQEQDGQEER
ncbi:MAG: histidine--tRNA ligase [Actinomycetia bacterium]|nr:histidine--tRNA ligase [Actinomycetes bacterium]